MTAPVGAGVAAATGGWFSTTRFVFQAGAGLAAELLLLGWLSAALQPNSRTAMNPMVCPRMLKLPTTSLQSMPIGVAEPSQTASASAWRMGR